MFSLCPLIPKVNRIYIYIYIIKKNKQFVTTHLIEYGIIASISRLKSPAISITETKNISAICINSLIQFKANTNTSD